MNNNMYPRQYVPNYNNYNQQSIYDQIDNEINSLQQMKERMKNNTQQNNVQPPSINQTFQLAPSSNNGMKYANTIEDVSKEQVFIDTPFFSKDMSVLWIKNNKGEIKSYELVEIIIKDDKDLMIEGLQIQIENLRKEVEKNAKSNATNDDEPTSNEKSTNVQSNRTIKKK